MGRHYPRKKIFPWKKLGVALAVVVVIGLVWTGLSNYEAKPPAEVKLDSIRLYNPKMLGKYGAEVVVLPTKHTIPGAIYDIELVYIGGDSRFSYSKKPVKWPELPVPFPGSARIKLVWGLSPNEEVYRAFAEEATKPVSERKNLKVEDLLGIEVTRR